MTKKLLFLIAVVSTVYNTTTTTTTVILMMMIIPRFVVVVVAVVALYRPSWYRNMSRHPHTNSQSFEGRLVMIFVTVTCTAQSIIIIIVVIVGTTIVIPPLCYIDPFLHRGMLLYTYWIGGHYSFYTSLWILMIGCCWTPVIDLFAR
jgi:hypothetical protein